jgi:Holliday junction resolvase RusA-like endonuclease
MITFTIPGEPQGKARPRVVRNKYTGKTKAYTPDKTATYEDLVRLKYKSTAKGVRFDTQPLEIFITANFAIPKSKSKKTKALMLENKIQPTKKPDVDNISKIICDALNGISYKDDSQIVRLNVIKRYAEIPSVEVEIKTIEIF